MSNTSQTRPPLAWALAALLVGTLFAGLTGCNHGAAPAGTASPASSANPPPVEYPGGPPMPNATAPNAAKPGGQ